MAKQSQINRNKKREKLVAQYAVKRAELKKIANGIGNHGVSYQLALVMPGIWPKLLRERSAIRLSLTLR